MNKTIARLFRPGKVKPLKFRWSSDYKKFVQWRRYFNIKVFGLVFLCVVVFSFMLVGSSKLSIFGDDENTFDVVGDEYIFPDGGFFGWYWDEWRGNRPPTDTNSETLGIEYPDLTKLSYNSPINLQGCLTEFLVDIYVYLPRWLDTGFVLRVGEYPSIFIKLIFDLIIFIVFIMVLVLTIPTLIIVSITLKPIGQIIAALLSFIPPVIKWTIFVFAIMFVSLIMVGDISISDVINDIISRAEGLI